MRNRAGQLVGDLNSPLQATASVPVPPVIIVGDPGFTDSRFEIRDITNENETEYNLFPLEINDPPILKKSIYKSSIPKILHVDGYSPSKKDVMYHDNDGLVKVLAGTSIMLAIDATQPAVLNVENGIPTVIENKIGLIYEWQFNGVALSEDVLQQQENELNKTTAQLLNEDPTQRKDKFEIYNNKLVFTNITERYNGVYTCVISNDIGVIVSEPVELQVIHTDKPDEAYFKKNLVKNPFAIDGTSEWSALYGTVESKAFSQPEAETELKKPHTVVFEHSVNEIYPHPLNINFNSVKDYNFDKLTKSQGYYFCRGPVQTVRNGERGQTAIYQDIDLSEIQDLIAGRVFGCNGVRAYFSCILGNGINYKPIDVLAKPNKNNPKLFYQGAPRLSYENILLGGFPCSPKDSARVIVQEFEGNTPLSSVYYNTNTGETTEVPALEFIDRIYNSYRDPKYLQQAIKRPSYLDRFDYTNSDIIALAGSIWKADEKNGASTAWLNEIRFEYDPSQPDPNTNTVLTPYWPGDKVTITNENTLDWAGNEPTSIFNMYKDLYTSQEAYYTYGQYAEFTEGVIRILNPRTNKIRITIAFEIDSSILSNDYLADKTIQPEWNGWDTPVSKFGNSWGTVINAEKSVKNLWQAMFENYADELAANPNEPVTNAQIQDLEKQLSDASTALTQAKEYLQSGNLSGAGFQTVVALAIQFSDSVESLTIRLEAARASAKSTKGRYNQIIRDKAYFGGKLNDFINESTVYVTPKAMATALGLILEPITYASPEVVDFRDSIVRVPTKQEDATRRPRPVKMLQNVDANLFLAAALAR